MPQQVADCIHGYAVMICNSFGIDDIHAFGVIGMRVGVILRILSAFFPTGEKLFYFILKNVWYCDIIVK